MDYTRKIAAFALDTNERWIFASTIGGQLLTLDADTLELRSESFGNTGGIECVAMHPTLPYVATLSIDYTIALWALAKDGSLRKLQTLRLREIEVEGYRFGASLPLSCPLAFHPSQRRLLTHNHQGALCELEFDDESWKTRFAVGLFREDDGTAYDVDYVRYCQDGKEIVALTFGGHLAVIDPEDPANPRLRWRYQRRTLHCCELLRGSEYLIASDTRRFIRFDLSGDKEPVISEPVVRDHLEQISINPSSGRVFATSFDRTVVELDPENMTLIGVVATAPFKLRWMHSYTKDPNALLVQCRNGALYKIDLSGRRPTLSHKETPNALWSGIETSAGEVVIGGEGPELLRIEVGETGYTQQSSEFRCTWQTTDTNPGTYVKRIVEHIPSGSLIQGRSDGTLHAIVGTQTRPILRLPSPVRDIATAPEGHDLFAVTEDGCAYRIDLETRRIEARFETGEEPLWSLAYNHERKVLAVGEREGKLHLLDAQDMSPISVTEGAYSPKRMIWRDEDRLLVGRGAELYEMNIRAGSMERVIPFLGNTIEDFAWDAQRRFLAVCTYARRICLFDMATWMPLDMTDFDLDFPKGLLWFSSPAHPYELMVFGRSGVCRRYRIHDERICNVGLIDERCSTPILDATGVTATPRLTT